MAKRHSAAAPPARLPLRVNDSLFLNEYFRNGQNATQAYRAVHPNVRYNTAHVQSSRLLRKPTVQAEIQRRTRYDAGITRAWCQTRLLDYEARANAANDYVAGASIAMDAAKLAGFLVDKKQDVTPVPTLTEPQLADELRKRGFVSVPTN